MRSRILAGVTLLVVLGGLWSRPAAAQTYTIPLHVIASGGTSSSEAGPYKLAGTIAQHDAFTVSQNTPYKVRGGFWAALWLSGFLDDPLVPTVSRIKAAHVTELRFRTDALRVHWGLQPATWTNATLTVGVTVMTATDVQELRDRLIEAYQAALVPSPTFGSALTPGTVISAGHISALRQAVLDLEAF